MSGKAATVADLQALLDETRFSRMLKMRVERIGDGSARVSVPFDPEFERPGGIVAGLVFVTAADVAVWLAIKTRLGMEDSSVTADMSTSFLSPLSRATLYCEAHVTKIGRSLVYATARCENGDGLVLAQHIVTYARRSSE